MAQILDEDDQQRLRDWILELFAPVRGPTRRGAEEVRFGLGEFDMPGMLFSLWAVMRGLVWAFLKVAPTAWDELKALVQEALDGMCTQWVSREERDLLFLEHAALRSKKAALSLELRGLQAEDEEIRASAPVRQPLVVPNLPAFQAWRARWNLADDRSFFTQALIVEAIDDTDLARQVPDDVMTLIQFTLFFDLGLVLKPDEISVFEPPPAESPEATLLPEYPPALRFEFPRFNPFFKTEVTFKKAAREAFKHQLDAHIDACYAALRGQGIALVPVKRVPDHHFRWYIRFQVLGQEKSEVARAECASVGAVSLALDDVAELAGVPLRESKRGRPRKKRPPSTSGISS
jgi:hypothetical protein